MRRGFRTEHRRQRQTSFGFRAYLRALIDNVEVDDTEIRIHGRRTVLERLVMAGVAVPAGVPSFGRKWRAREESNP